MAALNDGIERMLADVQWSTKSTYQIQSTFYVISQPRDEGMLCQTASWLDSACLSDDMHREIGRSTSQQPGLAAE